MKNTNKKILSIKNLEVKFRVRSRVLTAIRNVSFDLYDGEILALVGESGSGKSVITKTFTGMLESNGWISDGSIIYEPNQAAIQDEKSFFKTPVDLVNIEKLLIDNDVKRFIYNNNKKQVIKLKKQINKLSKFGFIESENDKNSIITDLDNKINEIVLKVNILKEKAKEFTKRKSAQKLINLESKLLDLQKLKKLAIDKKLLKEEIDLLEKKITLFKKDSLKIAMLTFKDKQVLRSIVSSIENFIENNDRSIAELNLEKINNWAEKKIYWTRLETELKKLFDQIIDKNTVDHDFFNYLMFDWEQVNGNFFKTKINAKNMIREVRGKTIATVFQDPMTSLNPLLTVGFQLTEILRRQLKMNRQEAKEEAIKLLGQVGIPNPKERYKDIPGRYSGGMRQRVVIAIALACRPKILICDEPTTALDVTIQAQILRLIKQLQAEYHFSVIFITHDLGVVANIADRVAVMYAGQIVEIGTVHEIFNDSRHPYTWALLLSLPQLGTKGEDLYSIGGTPPSLFNEIKGDAFAPRNKYALAIDYLYEPPMFKVSETHYAKTWLLHDKADKNLNPNKKNEKTGKRGTK